MGWRTRTERKVDIDIFQSMDSEQTSWECRSPALASIAAGRRDLGAKFTGAATAVAMRRNQTIRGKFLVSVSCASGKRRGEQRRRGWHGGLGGNCRRLGASLWHSCASNRRRHEKRQVVSAPQPHRGCHGTCEDALENASFWTLCVAEPMPRLGQQQPPEKRAMQSAPCQLWARQLRVGAGGAARNCQYNSSEKLCWRMGRERRARWMQPQTSRSLQKGCKPSHAGDLFWKPWGARAVAVGCAWRTGYREIVCIESYPERIVRRYFGMEARCWIPGCHAAGSYGQWLEGRHHPPRVWFELARPWRWAHQRAQASRPERQSVALAMAHRWWDQHG